MLAQMAPITIMRVRLDHKVADGIDHIDVDQGGHGKNVDWIDHEDIGCESCWERWEQS